MIIQRQLKVIVSVSSFRNIRNLKRFGLIIYSSKVNRYVVMYIDQDRYDNVKAMMLKLSSVQKITPSPLNDLVSTFSQTQSVDDDDDEI